NRLAGPAGRALGHARPERLRKDLAAQVPDRIPLPDFGPDRRPRPDLRADRLARTAAEDRPGHERAPGLDPPGRDRARDRDQRPLRPARPLGPPDAVGIRRRPPSPPLRRLRTPRVAGVGLPFP